MNRKHSGSFAALMILLMFSFTAFAQGKKTVKKYNIKSETVTTTDLSDGKERTFTESIQKFDKDVAIQNGQLLCR